MAGGEEGFKMRARAGDDLEPTQGAGPCLEDIDYLRLDAEALRDLWVTLSRREYNLVDILLASGGDYAIYARALVGDDCIRPVELHVDLCGDLSSKGLNVSDEPEVQKVILKREGGRDCVELVADFNPPVKPEALLEKIGITTHFNIIAYRPVE